MWRWGLTQSFSVTLSLTEALGAPLCPPAAPTCSPVPPSQQGHSNSLQLAPHSTCTSVLGGGHMGKLRLTELPNLPRGTDPSGDPTCGAIRSSSRAGQNKEEQGASSPPGCHFLSTSCTQPRGSGLESCAWRTHEPMAEGRTRRPVEGLMLKLKLQYFGHLMQRADSFEKTLMLGKIEGRRRRGRQRMRG